YLEILRHLWETPGPFDFQGEFYRLEGARLPVRPASDNGIPLYFGGASDAAVGVGAQYADVYMLWGEPLADSRERVDRVRAEGAKHGRTLHFSVSVRPILADTEAAAWTRADEIAERAIRHRQQFISSRGRRDETSVGSARLRAAAARADVHDT